MAGAQPNKVLKMNNKYAFVEKVLSAFFLAMALLGLFNLFYMDLSIIGLSPKQLSILVFLPGAFLAYYIRARRTE